MAIHPVFPAGCLTCLSSNWQVEQISNSDILRTEWAQIVKGSEIADRVMEITLKMSARESKEDGQCASK